MLVLVKKNLGPGLGQKEKLGPGPGGTGTGATLPISNAASPVGDVDVSAGNAHLQISGYVTLLNVVQVNCNEVYNADSFWLLS